MKNAKGIFFYSVIGKNDFCVNFFGKTFFFLIRNANSLLRTLLGDFRFVRVKMVLDINANYRKDFDREEAADEL